MLESIQSLVSPKIMLGLLKYEIERRLKLKVVKFNISYVRAYSDIKFHITDKTDKIHKVPFIDENDQLSKTISSQLKNLIEKDVIIDAFQLFYGEKISCKVFFKDEKGIKTVIELNL